MINITTAVTLVFSLVGGGVEIASGTQTIPHRNSEVHPVCIEHIFLWYFL